MSNHHKIHYIELPAIDLGAMKTFYSAVFGWTFTDYGPTYASFSGAGIDGGFDTAGGGRKPSKQGALVILYSDDLEASLAALTAHGAEITVPIFDFPGGRRFHFTDPSGNELAIWTEPKA
ncbi:VOC family protein [Robiginitomaculum antarcticum]|uniref:VOC family protein n=1 Tax=Robiginitomaculum antarcticum TaxID=437507 RepID=UPI00036D7567|nr:VOC family protein [Robiginitomaculum antarcticum]